MKYIPQYHINCSLSQYDHRYYEFQLLRSINMNIYVMCRLSFFNNLPPKMLDKSHNAELLMSWLNPECITDMPWRFPKLFGFFKLKVLLLKDQQLHNFLSILIWNMKYVWIEYKYNLNCEIHRLRKNFIVSKWRSNSHIFNADKVNMH